MAKLRFKFGKLVRDDVVKQQIAAGARPKWRHLSGSRHKRELIRKIQEESGEILQAKPEAIAAELADVQQALDDLVALYGLTAKDILGAQKRKTGKYGAFKKGSYVEYIECDEDYSWVKHFREDPERYPEISGSSSDKN